MSVLKITSENFEREILEKEGTALVDFWAPWCGPCRMMSPVIDEIADEVGDSIKVGKVNVDEEPELAQRFGIMSIPTLVVLKDGIEITRSNGARPKSSVMSMIENI